MSDTPSLSLPFLAASQAQKHVTLNGALLRLDALVHLSLKSRAAESPPSSPEDGDRYLVPSTPSGDWSGHDGAVAAWQDGAWTFIEPRRGWRAWIDDERTLLVHDDGEWIDVVGSTLPKFSSSTLGNAVTADPSGTWNDFDWAGWNGTHPDRATHIRLSPSAPLVLTGLSGGAPGRLAVLSNVSSGTSSNLVVVPHDSSSSFSANRVAFCDAMPRMLMPGDSLALLYDAGRSRWIELHARTFAVGFDLFSDADGPGCFASTTSGEAARSACGGDHGFSDASGAPRGLFELATGNTAGGGASWGGAEGHLSGGGGACLFLARLAVETLSAWPDRYVLRAGLHDGGLADAANGVWWEYDASTASTWRRSAGSSGTIIRNSGGLVVGTGYAWLAIFLNESWSRADFLWSIDGVWTIDGGPASGLDLAGRRLAIGVDVVKGEGISSRSAYVDLMGLRYPARRG